MSNPSGSGMNSILTARRPAPRRYPVLVHFHRAYFPPSSGGFAAMQLPSRLPTTQTHLQGSVDFNTAMHAGSPACMLTHCCSLKQPGSQDFNMYQPPGWPQRSPVRASAGLYRHGSDRACGPTGPAGPAAASLHGSWKKAQQHTQQQQQQQQQQGAPAPAMAMSSMGGGWQVPGGIWGAFCLGAAFMLVLQVCPAPL